MGATLQAEEQEQLDGHNTEPSLLQRARIASSSLKVTA
jgi:hypothetical protein